jgi:hypothetical protein
MSHHKAENETADVIGTGWFTYPSNRKQMYELTNRSNPSLIT